MLKIDEVHDLQRVFREILKGMSRPGTITNVLKADSDYKQHEYPCSLPTWLTILTLLDSEVSYTVLSEETDEIKNKISAYTLAKYTEVAQADFIIVLKGCDESIIKRALSECKIGTLIDPDQAATWVFEIESISSHRQLQLKGPGIKAVKDIEIAGMSNIWKGRSEKVKEYPLGIDMIFADQYGNLVCIPRTTKVEEKVSEWVM
ncbi:phosphonate C-P lyase system protein PhnH [Alkalihalobacillus sp. 1P02AB]|uniref:phosphonate C-P lyase system protein PhnH n=1 Tax=Alkalihalobacillus sp. 1P02AB TaxID=3132260 RepID=UPI0039A4EEDC